MTEPTPEEMQPEPEPEQPQPEPEPPAPKAQPDTVDTTFGTNGNSATYLLTSYAVESATPGAALLKINE